MKEVGGGHSIIVKLTNEEAKTICKLGQGDKCCAFLIFSPTGFECILRDYPVNSYIFNRLEKGTMNAKGRGGWKGCAWEETKNLS